MIRQVKSLDVREDQDMVFEIEKDIIEFESTLWFKQLSKVEQEDAKQIILLFSEYMLVYHGQTMEEWDSVGLNDVVLNRMTQNIVAGVGFFIKIPTVLKKFFEFLYYQKQMDQGLFLAHVVSGLSEDLLRCVSDLLDNGMEENMLDLGEEMGLDISSLKDIEKLTRFVHKFACVSQRHQLYCQSETTKVKTS